MSTWSRCEECGSYFQESCLECSFKQVNSSVKITDFSIPDGSDLSKLDIRIV